MTKHESANAGIDLDHSIDLDALETIADWKEDLAPKNRVYEKAMLKHALKVRLFIVGTISKSSSMQVRIALSEWRGRTKLELQETSRVVGDIFFPVGAPVTISVEQLTELLSVINRARKMLSSSVFKHQLKLK